MWSANLCTAKHDFGGNLPVEAAKVSEPKRGE